MRFQRFLTLSLLFSLSSVFADALGPRKRIRPLIAPDVCSATQAPGYEKTLASLLLVKNCYTYLIQAFLNENPIHDQLVQYTKLELSTLGDLINQAEDVNIADDSSFRRQYIHGVLRKVSAKVLLAQDIIKTGVPSWPWLGKTIKKSSIWADFKAKVGAWLHIKSSIAGVENVDKETAKVALETCQKFQSYVVEVESLMSELANKNVCNSSSVNSSK